MRFIWAHLYMKKSQVCVCATLSSKFGRSMAGQSWRPDKSYRFNGDESRSCTPNTVVVGKTNRLVVLWVSNYKRRALLSLETGGPEQRCGATLKQSYKYRSFQCPTKAAKAYLNRCPLQFAFLPTGSKLWYALSLRPHMRKYTSMQE